MVSHPVAPHQTFPTGGRCRSLLIGINYSGQKAELKGCVNDVVKMKEILEKYGYPQNEQRILVDEHIEGQTGQPTKEEILKSLAWLANDAKPGDTLFLQYSGHGIQFPDANGDEEDGKDEALVPSDYKKKGIIRDDIIHDVLLKDLPAGVRLTAVMDCCHSGSILDLPFQMVANDESMPALLRTCRSHVKKNSTWFNSALNKIGLCLLRPNGPQGKKSANFEACNKKALLCDAICFSGCRDGEASSDYDAADADEALSTIEAGSSGGVCTAALIEVLSKKEQHTIIDLIFKVREILKSHSFRQVPQLSSSKPVDLQRPFSFFGPIDDYHDPNDTHDDDSESDSVTSTFNNDSASEFNTATFTSCDDENTTDRSMTQPHQPNSNTVQVPAPLYMNAVGSSSCLKSSLGGGNITSGLSTSSSKASFLETSVPAASGMSPTTTTLPGSVSIARKEGLATTSSASGLYQQPRSKSEVPSTNYQHSVTGNTSFHGLTSLGNGGVSPPPSATTQLPTSVSYSNRSASQLLASRNEQIHVDWLSSKRNGNDPISNTSMTPPPPSSVSFYERPASFSSLSGMKGSATGTQGDGKSSPPPFTSSSPSTNTNLPGSISTGRSSVLSSVSPTPPGSNLYAQGDASNSSRLPMSTSSPLPASSLPLMSSTSMSVPSSASINAAAIPTYVTTPAPAPITSGVVYTTGGSMYVPQSSGTYSSQAYYSNVSSSATGYVSQPYYSQAGVSAPLSSISSSTYVSTTATAAVPTAVYYTNVNQPQTFYTTAPTYTYTSY